MYPHEFSDPYLQIVTWKLYTDLKQNISSEDLNNQDDVKREVSIGPATNKLKYFLNINIFLTTFEEKICAVKHKSPR